MKFIAHKNDGKGLITLPVILIGESSLTPIEEMIKNIPSNLEPIIIDESDLPNRNYMESWVLENGFIRIDMEIAKDSFRELIRYVREPLFSSLDIQFQRALETGADTSEIVVQKQKLRDAPMNPKIDSASTIEELEACWDKSLLGENPYSNL